MREIRQTARGPLHMWPEKNCCGCEAQENGENTTCCEGGGMWSEIYTFLKVR